MHTLDPIMGLMDSLLVRVPPVIHFYHVFGSLFVVLLKFSTVGNNDGSIIVGCFGFAVAVQSAGAGAQL